MSDYKAIQQQFTDVIRANEAQSFDGIEDRRIAVYRELFFNNVEGFISGTFPVLKECLDEITWQQMVRQFFQQYQAETPYFLEISEEFLAFLNEGPIEALELPDYTYSLAHWEWMELFADSYQAQTTPKLEPINLESDILTTVECAWLQAYEFPVHKIEAGVNVEKQPAFLLVYRDVSDSVQFIELNPLSFLLFQSLSDNVKSTIYELIEVIAQNNSMDAQQLIAGAMDIIGHWADLQLIQKV